MAEDEREARGRGPAETVGRFLSRRTWDLRSFRTYQPLRSTTSSAVCIKVTSKHLRSQPRWYRLVYACGIVS
jgi:hypothetical protein